MRSPPPKPLVLVIEDDRQLMSAVAMLIEDWGYECMAVSSPAQAAAALGERIALVAAVVADVSMKESYTGGRGAASIMATIGPKIPVIATSSFPRLAVANGFATVLAKPYDPDDLRQWLIEQVGPGFAETRKAC